MQERQLGGYQTAEAEGRLIRKQVILSPVTVTAGTVGPANAEQSFTIAGVLATDFSIKGNPETANAFVQTATASLALAGNRVSGISAIALNYVLTGTLPVTPTTSILYTFLIYRR